MRKAVGFLIVPLFAQLQLAVVANAADGHDAHLNAAYGPQLICADCHDPHSGGGGSLLLDGQDFANTKICNTCHSDERAFDGVAIAKANWHTGVYSGEEIVRNYQRH